MRTGSRRASDRTMRALRTNNRNRKAALPRLLSRGLRRVDDKADCLTRRVIRNDRGAHESIAANSMRSPTRTSRPAAAILRSDRVLVFGVLSRVSWVGPGYSL